MKDLFTACVLLLLIGISYLIDFVMGKKEEELCQNRYF